jgi:hypothetical protein
MDSEYSKARTLLVTASGISYVWIFVGASTEIEVPGLGVRVSGESTIALTLSVLVCFFLAWTCLEWWKFPENVRKRAVSKIDLVFSSILALGAIGVLLFRLSPTNAVWGIPPTPAIVIVALGELSAVLLSTVLFSLQFIRSKSTAEKRMLPRVPFATKAQFPWIVVIAVLSGSLVFWVQNTQPSEFRVVWYSIYFVPVFIHVVSSVIGRFRMDPNRLESIQQAFDTHDATLLSLRQKGFSAEEIAEATQVMRDDQLELLRLQLKSGLNPNDRGPRGWTPLMTAAANGDERAFELLLEYGGDVNVRNDLGRSALDFACNYGNQSMVTKLLDAGANPNLQHADKGTPLMVAATKGHAEIVEALLKAGADVTAVDRQKQTALDQAEANGNGEVARLLRKSMISQNNS